MPFWKRYNGKHKHTSLSVVWGADCGVDVQGMKLGEFADAPVCPRCLIAIAEDAERRRNQAVALVAKAEQLEAALVQLEAGK